MWLSTNAGATKAPVEVDDLRVTELGAAHVVAAQPGHDTVAHGHRGGVRVRRTVHASVEQQCGHVGQCARAGERR